VAGFVFFDPHGVLAERAERCPTIAHKTNPRLARRDDYHSMLDASI
jgi:hypothetical protein